MRARFRCCGFTLVELLVVIAIVAILASLLLPGLWRAKASAYSVKCQHNLHQIGVAMAAYLSDDNAYPTFLVQIGEDGVRGGAWKELLNPYIQNQFRSAYPFFKEDQIVCPSLDPKSGSSGTAAASSGLGDRRQSYGYNALGLATYASETAPGLPGMPRLSELGLGGWFPKGSVRQAALSDANVIRPALMLSVGDAFVESASGIRQDSVLFGMNFFEPSVWSSPVALKAANGRHQGRLNAVLCDGHVESLRWTDLFNRKRDESLARWNNDHQPHRALLLP